MPRAALALVAALVVAVPCTASQAAQRPARDVAVHLEAPPTAVPVPAAAPAGSSLSVSIPAGALTVSADGKVLTISDTRPGNQGFSVVATAERAATIGVRAEQVPGNAMRAEDVRVAGRPVRVRAGEPVTVASFPAGLSLGTVRLRLTGPADKVTWTVL